MHLTPARLAALFATVLSTACGGGGGSDTPPVPVPPPPSAPDLATRTAAATTTAASTTNACKDIQPYYWEIGNGTGRLAGASIGATYTADTQMPIASASKWLYGAYVAERRAGVLTDEDTQFLNFRSGYTNFAATGCDNADTVASCVARGTNGLQSPETVGKFYYNGAHMQKHASLPARGMDLGALDNAGLATEVRRLLGTDIALTYTQPQLAGGVRTNATNYAIYLRKLLNNQLKMATLLGSHPVCTNPRSCTDALQTPITADVDWHYSIGHWVEDDPDSGDGAYSSAGAFGFYPWVDKTKTWYGVIARVDAAGGGNDSAVCGALIRQAWVSGVAR